MILQIITISAPAHDTKADVLNKRQPRIVNIAISVIVFISSSLN